MKATVNRRGERTKDLVLNGQGLKENSRSGNCYADKQFKFGSKGLGTTESYASVKPAQPTLQVSGSKANASIPRVASKDGTFESQLESPGQPAGVEVQSKIG